MKIRALIPWLFLLCMVSAQAVARNNQTSPSQRVDASRTLTSSSGTDSTTPSKIDPAKEAAIRQLIDLTGATNVVNQSMDGMQKNLKPMMANIFPPGEYRDKLVDLFFQKFPISTKDFFVNIFSFCEFKINPFVCW